MNKEIIDNMVLLSINKQMDQIIKRLTSTEPINILIKPVDESIPFVLPKYATSGSVAMDISSSEKCELLPGNIRVVSTNISVSLPDGYELQVRSRSGLAAKHGIMVLNSPGTIDSDYRGEIKVILKNTSETTFNIEIGDRIAQLLLAKPNKISWNVVDKLPDTERGTGGLGHTGLGIPQAYMDYVDLKDSSVKK